MILSVLERLLLLNILPKEGTITTLKIIRDMKGDLGFSEEEHKVLQFKEEEGMTLWSPAGDQPKEVAIGEKATDIIVKALKDLSSQGKLPEDYIGLYDRLIKE